MFNSIKWLESVVRTSSYIYEESKLTFDNLSSKQLGQELCKITELDFNIDSTAALLPARYPKNVNFPEVVFSDWNSFVQPMIDSADIIHPAVKHLVLSLALFTDDVSERKQRLDSVKELYTKGVAYQPTLTWTSLLMPDWYDADKKITPSIRGGNKSDELKGVSTSLIITKDKIRINPTEMFTSTRVVAVTDAYYMAEHQTWIDTVNNHNVLDYPLATSAWVYGLGDKSVLWDTVPVGGALYSPFYSNTEIDALVLNQSQISGAGYFFRPGNGISDIYPLKDDPVLSNYINVFPLFEAPLSTGGVCAIKNLASHPGSPVGLPLEWGIYVFEQVKLMSSMDLIPSYSAFSEESGNNMKVLKQATAFDALSEFSESGDPSSFDDLLKALLHQQALLMNRFEDKYVDSSDFGYPNSYRYIDFNNRLSFSAPECVDRNMEI